MLLFTHARTFFRATVKRVVRRTESRREGGSDRRREGGSDRRREARMIGLTDMIWPRLATRPTPNTSMGVIVHHKTNHEGPEGE